MCKLTVTVAMACDYNTDLVNCTGAFSASLQGVAQHLTQEVPQRFLRLVSFYMIEEGVQCVAVKTSSILKRRVL
jgi:hypothetical protein